MKNDVDSKQKQTTAIKLLAVAVLVPLLILSLNAIPSRMGKLDYRAYWSASYLLAHGEDFADDSLLMTTQRELTGFDRDYATKTWNPPWVLVWLIPFTWVGFDTAAKWWLATNIGSLILSVFLSWQMLFPAHEKGPKWLWLPFLAAVLFPSTIVSIMVGQVNLIVLAGLIGFLVLYYRGKDAASGLVLALTTIKPHLVYLVIPIALLQAWRRGRPGIVAGFFAPILVSTLIAILLRPTLLMDYFQGTTEGNLLAWENASLVTYLSTITGWSWIRLAAVALLPLTLIVWFFIGRQWKVMKVAQIGVLASLITMPFGWSYDFVLLLLPLTQILVWLVTEDLPIMERLLITAAVLLTYAAYYSQRIATPSDLYFFWVPLAIAAIYSWMAWRTAPRAEADALVPQSEGRGLR